MLQGIPFSRVLLGPGMPFASSAVMTFRSFSLFPLAMAAWLHAAPAQADREFADGQRFGFELGFGGGFATSSPFTRRLESFGYSREEMFSFRFDFSFEAIVLPYLSVLLRFDVLDGQTWRRPSGIGPRRLNSRANLISWGSLTTTKTVFSICSRNQTDASRGQVQLESGLRGSQAEYL